jgi:TetR/AcrR family transcriptional regulator, copper-responsive repressor
VIAMKKRAAPSRRGRPLQFDREAALEVAIQLFRRHGYEATSLARLTGAMGISPPSLYAAFGDKRRLFLEAVERYARGGVETARAVAEEPTARGAILRHLMAAAGDPSARGVGCLFVVGALACQPGSEEVEAALRRRRRQAEAMMRDRIQRGIDDGELPPETDAAALARFCAVIVQGIAVQARDGATPARLRETVEVAMRAWPERDHPRPRRSAARR